MSEMKLIMESWRKFEKEYEIPKAAEEELYLSPVFLFENNSKKHANTMTFGKLFENLENNKISLDTALKMWEKSTLYEISQASQEEKEILEELFGKRGWEKEASSQSKEAGEEDPTRTKADDAKDAVKKKGLIMGSKIVFQIIGKGLIFRKMVSQAIQSAAKKAQELLGSIKDKGTLGKVASVIGSIVLKAAKMFLKAVKTIGKLIMTALGKYSSIMGRPDVKLALIGLCLALATLSIWFPAFYVIVPFALKRAARIVVGTAAKKGFKKGKDLVMNKVKAGKESAAAMAESLKRQLNEIIENLEWADDVKDISNAIGRAILQLADEVGDSNSTMAIKTLAAQTNDGSFSSMAVEFATEADAHTKDAHDAMSMLYIAEKKVRAAKNTKEAMKILSELDDNAAEIGQMGTTVAKKALEFAGKLCEADEEFCASQAQLTKDLAILTDSNIKADLVDWAQQTTKKVGGKVVDATSSQAVVSTSDSVNTSYVSGYDSALPES
jgi:hypothetical protein